MRWTHANLLPQVKAQPPRNLVAYAAVGVGAAGRGHEPVLDEAVGAVLRRFQRAVQQIGQLGQAERVVGQPAEPQRGCPVGRRDVLQVCLAAGADGQVADGQFVQEPVIEGEAVRQALSALRSILAAPAMSPARSSPRPDLASSSNRSRSSSSGRTESW